jgi:GH24 family phage-related lysozyme (muramidase)
MKLLLIIIQILLTLFNNLNETTPSIGTKLTYKKSTRDYQYENLYNITIEFTKKNEGFRANWYDDGGYACIGFGQRQQFYHKRIVAPITEEQGEEILRDSFNKHIQLVRRLHPRLNRFEVLAMAHLSYNAGISKVNKVLEGTELNQQKLYSICYPQCRVFEYNLFNYGKERKKI